MSANSHAMLEEERDLFRPFTRKSLAVIEQRIAEEHGKQKEPKKTAEGEVRKDDEGPQPDATLEQGAKIPVRLQSSFPRKLALKPLEDIDSFYQNQRTFVVVSKRKEIFRFSAANAMWILDPFSPIRRVAIYTLVHPLFSYFILSTILTHCFFMIMPTTPAIESAEIYFTAIYTIELAVKVLARGFILQPFTYLRDAWNWLDLILLAIAYVTMSADRGSLAALRSFRALRALKPAAVIPGLRTAVGAVIESVRNLRDVIIFIMFLLFMFALLGLQIYMGVLTQKCIKNFPTDGSWGELTDENWHMYNSNETNWHGSGPQYVVCGNSSGAGLCEEGYICLQGFGRNPDYGYTNFDTFGWASLSAFRLMTEDYWESLYQLILRSAGPWHMLFFIGIIFTGTFYLVNLILATIAITYNKLQKKAEEESLKEAKGAAQAKPNEIEAKPAAKLAGSATIAAASGTDQNSTLADDESTKEKQQENPFIDTQPPLVDMKDVMGLNDIVEEAASKDNRTSNHGVSTYYFPTEDDEEGPTLKEKVVKVCHQGIDIFCVWNCCWPWVKFQDFVKLLVFDPFVVLFITVCIIVNTLFMALDHHDMNVEMENLLRNGNYFFTAIFAVEAILKVIAMSPKYYFREAWNIFDFIVAFLPVLELGLEGVQGLSVLRSYRLLRVFRLAKSWPTFNLILSSMGRTVGTVINLSFLLCITIFIFALLGMQLFGENYIDNVDRFPESDLPRWNFIDFLHSFMIVFRILCGEWIETMWDCTFVGGWSCIPFFLAAVVIGNLVVLNLFLAMLFSNFGSSYLAVPRAPDTNKIEEAFDRISHFINWVKRKLLNVAKLRRAKLTNQTPGDLKNKMKIQGKMVMNNTDEVVGNAITLHMLDDNRLDNASQINRNDDTLSTKFDGSPKNCPNNDLSHKGRVDTLDGEEKRDASKEDLDQDGDVEVNNMGQEAPVRVPDPDTATETKGVPSDCCPSPCYKIFPFLAGDGDSPFWQRWGNLRLITFRLVENKYFETAVLTMILLSSLALALEDVHLFQRPILQVILYYMDRIFTVIFFLEMLVKWLALGFKKYFTNPWCWLDFIIVMLYLINLAAIWVGVADIPAFSAIYTLRALGPLRAVSRWERMRVVVIALVQVIPSIFSVLSVCLILWLIFAIMGVQLFAGKYFKCLDENETTVSYEVIPDRNACINEDYSWVNSPMNFDHVGNAYLSLFQVATFKGWIQIMNDAVDSREVDKQPIREINIYMYLYFVFFIIYGSFFSLNVSVGAIIDHFNEQKNKAGGSLEMFMTEEQKKSYAMKKMGSKKPLKAIPRPKWKPQAIVFEIVTNKKFDIIIMTIIGFDMLAMALDHYQQTQRFSEVLDTINMIIISIYSVECLMKIFALRHHYFKDSLNLFDFMVVVLSILGLVLNDLIAKYFISPTLLRVGRVGRVGRVLRWVKGAKGIRTLLSALARSTPALFNICLLLFLVMFVFAVFGMSLFMHVKEKSGIDDVYNFQTFGQSMILLFQISTLAGWDGVLDAIINEEDCQLPNKEIGFPGDCGSAMIGIPFILSYLCIIFFIIINMHIAVILEIYLQVTKDADEPGAEDASGSCGDADDPRQQTAVVVESDGLVAKNGHKEVILPRSHSPSAASQTADV